MMFFHVQIKWNHHIMKRGFLLLLVIMGFGAQIYEIFYGFDNISLDVDVL